MFNFDIFCLHKICFFGLEDEEENNIVIEEHINRYYPSEIVMER